MNRHYIKYYLNQTGGSIDEIGPLWHSGVAYQRGRGLGNIFGGLFRYIRPFLSSGLDLLKKEAFSTGISALSDIASGANPQEVLQDRSKMALKSLRRDAVNKLQSMYGSGKKRVKTIKKMCGGRRKTIKRKQILKNSHSHSRKRRKRITKKKRILDIFD